MALIEVHTETLYHPSQNVIVTYQYWKIFGIKVKMREWITGDQTQINMFTNSQQKQIGFNTNENTNKETH